MQSITTPIRRRHKRRWFQFGLRGMLLLTAVLGLFLGISAHYARQREQALRTVRELGGTVFYNNDAPEFVNRLLGETWFCRVVAVDLAFTETTGADLKCVEAELAPLKTLSWIRISGTNVSTQGAESLGNAVPHATIYYAPGAPRTLARVRNQIPMAWGEDPWMRPSVTK